MVLQAYTEKGGVGREHYLVAAHRKELHASPGHFKVLVVGVHIDRSGAGDELASHHHRVGELPRDGASVHGHGENITHGKRGHLMSHAQVSHLNYYD